MKTQFRRLRAFTNFIGLDNTLSSSTSDYYISLTGRFNFDLVKKIEQHKFKPDHGTDFLLYRRDPYWIFFHKPPSPTPPKPYSAQSVNLLNPGSDSLNPAA